MTFVPRHVLIMCPESLLYNAVRSALTNCILPDAHVTDIGGPLFGNKGLPPYRFTPETFPEDWPEQYRSKSTVVLLDAYKSCAHDVGLVLAQPYMALLMFGKTPDGNLVICDLTQKKKSIWQDGRMVFGRCDFFYE